MVNRREFAGLVGAGGLGSLLLQRAAVAAVPRPVGDPIGSALNFGIDHGNIGQVRELVRGMVPLAQRQAMAGNLRTIRDHYLQGQPGQPTAAIQALQAQIEPWLPSLGQGVLEIAGNGVTRLEGAAVPAPETDKDPIDWWSLVHFLSGFGLGCIGLDFFTTLLILILWEIIEPTLWEWLTGDFDETLENQIMDVIIGMLGWYLARLLFANVEGKATVPALGPAVEALP